MLKDLVFITRSLGTFLSWLIQLLLLFSRSAVSDSFSTPWTVGSQASLTTGILQAGTLKWVAIFCSRGSSRPRGDQILIYTGRWILCQ